MSVQDYIDDMNNLDWLEESQFSLVSDDAGRWACVVSVFQNVPDNDKATDISTTFWIEADEWKNSIREAIDYAIKKEKGEKAND